LTLLGNVWYTSVRAKLTTSRKEMDMLQLLLTPVVSFTRCIGSRFRSRKLSYKCEHCNGKFQMRWVHGPRVSCLIGVCENMECSGRSRVRVLGHAEKPELKLVA
jgi:hypothetical protein